MDSISNKFILLFVAFFLLVVSITEATHTLTVDCNSKIRKSTHCASGSLYGLIENKPADYQSLVAPLHPYVFNNPARAGNGRQQPIGDSIKVARRLASTPGAKVSIRLADLLPGWPYGYKGIQHWKSEVQSFVNDKKASGLTNWYGYEIWNEPDGTWKDSNGSFNDFWKQTYQLLRQIDPNEKIIGPSLSWYNEGRIKEFLQYAKANNCLPDIISWHELSGIDGMSSHFRSYRNLERSLGIKELPISINEYCDSKHELEGQPGSSARFIGKFERYKIDTGMITWWFVPLPGRLGSLLASDTQKGAGWYLYKWYGDMNGDMVNVTPPKDDSNLVDGAACVDDKQKTVSFIFGGPNDGSINAVFKNLPSFVGSNPTVKVEKVDWKNKDTPSNGPNTISEKKISVSNGQLTVNVPGTNESSGYHIVITGDGSSSNNQNTNPQPNPQPNPQTSTSSSIASGGTYEIVNRNSGKCLCVQYDAVNDDSNVHQWEYIAHTSQQWIITGDNNGYKIIDNKSKKPLDVRAASTQDGGNVVINSDKGNKNQRWIIKETGDGYITIQNSNSGKFLDVEKSSMEDGGNVIQWTGNGNYNQQWQLIRLDAPTTTTSKQQTQPTSEATDNCSANILKQGYKCCPNNCVVIYTDNDGTWGVNNGEWCGCNMTKSSNNCPAAITSQGYKCCSDNNCAVYEVDGSGQWGIENNEWCGISSKC
ncbi:carbohydrate-binding module family 13 [Piromyces sp. E2]|nr:carbohydrate-binding module family 13 [Piromyces sp. E2]|eukprot:OUM57376.1 carbohydrate-binding module family 13 [Piromyces sp. E2]